MDGHIAIRPLQTLDEFRACHGVQKEAWGFPDLLIIPYTQLVSAHHHGGVVLGAFDGTALVGFVYGYLARQGQGPLYLFSQRMGVLSTYQGQGIGERLKWAQRAWALDHQLERIIWTFDPLESPNAWLNITRLGGIGRQYLRDIYGLHDTPLHDRLPSDRLLVEWELQSKRVLARLGPEGAVPTKSNVPTQAGLPLNAVALDDQGLPRSEGPELDHSSPILLITVPAQWQPLRKANMALAADWRTKTRRAFEHYLDRGYAVTGYVRGRGNESPCNTYVLERNP